MEGMLGPLKRRRRQTCSNKTIYDTEEGCKMKEKRAKLRVTFWRYNTTKDGTQQ